MYIVQRASGRLGPPGAKRIALRHAAETEDNYG